MTRQPGIIAAIVVLIAAALGATAQWGWAWLDHRARLLNQGEPYYFMLNAHAMLAQRAGFAVLIAWLTLAISGRWRAGRGRLDRFGRALGVYWIATAILASYFVDRVIWWGSFLDNL